SAAPRMAADRVAYDRGSTRQVLALQLAGGYSHREDREPRADALARRARLRGTQRRAWPRPLRRERLARIPSSRCFMHRRLRVPHSRASSAFPPTPSILPPTGSPTRRFPPEGKSQCGLSATTPHRSRPFDLSSRVRLLELFRAAPAAVAYDTVVLARRCSQGLRLAAERQIVGRIAYDRRSANSKSKAR